jgi:hypothetical protein
MGGRTIQLFSQKIFEVKVVISERRAACMHDRHRDVDLLYVGSWKLMREDTDLRMQYKRKRKGKERN